MNSGIRFLLSVMICFNNVTMNIEAGQRFLPEICNVYAGSSVSIKREQFNSVRILKITDNIFVLWVSISEQRSVIYFTELKQFC